MRIRNLVTLRNKKTYTRGQHKMVFLPLPASIEAHPSKFSPRYPENKAGILTTASCRSVVGCGLYLQILVCERWRKESTFFMWASIGRIPDDRLIVKIIIMAGIWDLRLNMGSETIAETWFEPSSELQPWRWRQCVPPKRWYPPTSPHGIISQKVNIDILSGRKIFRTIFAEKNEAHILFSIHKRIYLYVCFFVCLRTLSAAYVVQRPMEARMWVMTWKNVEGSGGVAYFKVSSQHVPGGT
jgi:hypothetical protein